MAITKPTISLVILLMLTTACTPRPESISQVTSPPANVTVTNISEGEAISSEITQHKTFNQCDSASSFSAEIRFGDSSSQGSQQALVLKGVIGGEIGVSQLAKIALEGAIEQHFSSSLARGQEHQESVIIEIPNRTQQEYTIVWRESRREGTIQYIENGETNSVNYSYRIGLELVSARGQDLPCPGQTPEATTLFPTNTPYPTYTPHPTYTPFPEPTNFLLPSATPISPPVLPPEPESGRSYHRCFRERWQSDNKTSVCKAIPKDIGRCSWRITR
jgi:hypothetical protein